MHIGKLLFKNNTIIIIIMQEGQLSVIHVVFLYHGHSVPNVGSYWIGTTWIFLVDDCIPLYLYFPFSGIISGVNVYNANPAIGIMWIVLGVLWFCFVPLAALMVFMVCVQAGRCTYLFELIDSSLLSLLWKIFRSSCW